MKKLIWFDAFAALTSGVVVIALKGFFAPLFNLPAALLTVLALTAFCYAVYSFQLAFRAHKPPPLIWLLIIANTIYALACLVLFFVFLRTATWLGSAYLLLDFSIVAALTFIEYRTMKREKGG